MNTPPRNSDKSKISVKIGVQTMMWGSRLTSTRLKQVLQEIAVTAKSVYPNIKEIGIEFGQKVHHLCCDITDNEIHNVTLRDFFSDDEIRNLTNDELYCHKKDVLRARNIAEILHDPEFDGVNLPKLTLLGFSGRGSLKKRIEFCKILKKIRIQDEINGDLKEIEGLIPRYFMIHQWYKEDGYYKSLAKDAADCIGAPLALHPFRFGPCDKRDQIDKQLREIDLELKEENVPQVQFIPDTAHLWLANIMTLPCDPDAIDWIFEAKLHRITVFHLKDWRKTFDSSLRYYSSGFTALGGGDISKYADGVEKKDQRESDLGKICRRFEINPGGVEKKRWGPEKERWVVFEQDFTINAEKGSLQHSLEWFRDIVEGKVVSEPPENRLPATLRSNENILRTAEDEMSKSFEDRKRQIISALHYLASDKSEHFVTILQDLCRYLFYGDRYPEHNTDEDAKNRPVHIALWEMSPRIHTMVLLNKNEDIVGGDPVGLLTAKRSYVMENDACTGFRIWEYVEIENQNPEHKAFLDAYCTTPEQLKKRFDRLSKAKNSTNHETVISIPLCNTYNYNQIEARLDVFTSSQKLPVFTEVQQDESGNEKKVDIAFGQEGYRYRLESYLDDLVQNISSALEKVWGNAAYQTTSDLIEEVWREDQTSDVMLKTLLDKLTAHFDLEGCIYYELSKEDGTLRKYAPWLSDGSIDDFFECNKGDPGYQSKTYDDFWIGDDTKQNKSWMTFPIYVPAGREKKQDKHSFEALGIIRCFRTNGKSFTSSDETTAHKMLADFVPLFLIRYISERRMRSTSFIRHELRNPLGAINVAVENITKVIEDNKLKFHGNKDYGKEIGRYTTIMDQVLDNSFYLTGKEITLNFDSEKVPLIKDIVMPAINQGLYILFSDDKEESDMRKKILVYCNGYQRGDFPDDPAGTQRWQSILSHGPAPLYIDGARMLQVFFNLLVNAIKYRPQRSKEGIDIYLNRLPYDSNPKYFNRAKMGPEGYMPEYDQNEWAAEILFCNKGLGIPEKSVKYIFEDGFRAANIKSKFQGDGLGLWVCRKILQKHKSEISLVWNGGASTPSKPTMFRILLNKSLKELHQ